MAMRTTPYNMTIADYKEQLKNKQITVNHTYQRSDKVWPTSAKSNLIDTILCGYPVPKLIFSQTTDLDTMKTRKEVVDGQQRTAAIIEFLENKYMLSRREYVGKRFEDLDDSKKQEFLDYAISGDMFTSASEEEIREVFRRINSYQVPLNKQETRHATHQGEFKWFIHGLGTNYASSFVKMGILTEKQISRMADLEFLTELVDVVVNGIKTASPSNLDKLYRDRDKSFSDKKSVDDQIRFGLGEIIDMPDIHKTRIVNRGNAYTLFAALVAVNFSGAVTRDDLHSSEVQNPFVDRADILTNLTTLSDALENEDENFAEFFNAARQGTNTANNRKIRFKWFHRALTSKSL